jgi:hypothetical protein
MGRLNYIVKEQGCFWFKDAQYPECKVPCYMAIDWPIKKIGNILTHPELFEDTQNASRRV